MTITDDREIDIFVGSKIGSFKHIKYYNDPMKHSKKYIENLVEIKTLQKDEGITCMEWANEDQTEILLGRKNQQIQIYNTIQGFTKTYTADFATGEVVGIGRHKRMFLAAVSSGTVKIWSKKTEVLVETGGKLDRMRVSPDDAVFATGGEENDLKIWRIGEAQPIFVAKNLAHDWLQLRRPVWVSDLTFIPGTDCKVAAVSSRHGYVRLYDSRAQRRPVCNIDFENMAATCITPAFDGNNVLVGFARGQLHLADFRRSRPDKGFKGAVGAVTSLALTQGAKPKLISTSLDRWIRVHDYASKELIYKMKLSSLKYDPMVYLSPSKGSPCIFSSLAKINEKLSGASDFPAKPVKENIVRKPASRKIQKQYLTSKLTCVLAQTKTTTPLKNMPEQEVKEETKTEDVDCDDLDQLFDKMETVGEKPKRKLQKIKEENIEIEEKRAKPSTVGETGTEVSFETTTEEVKTEDKDEAIAKLLRSTEKHKKKLEKRKREKKKKSVFHNA